MSCLVFLPKFELHRQTMTATILQKFIQKRYIVIAKWLNNLSWFYQCTQDGKTLKKTCMSHFDPVRRSRKYNFSVVLLLRKLTMLPMERTQSSRLPLNFRRFFGNLKIICVNKSYLYIYMQTHR